MAANGQAADDGLVQDGFKQVSTSIGKRPIIQSVDSSGNVTQPTNQILQFGSDPSKATSGAIFITVAS